MFWSESNDNYSINKPLFDFEDINYG